MLHLSHLLKRASLLLLIALFLTGCESPYATVDFKPFPAAAESQPAEPVDPEITAACDRIHSVLIQNGYTTKPEWNTGGESIRGWFLCRMYEHRRPSAHVVLCNSGSRTNKPSAVITVTFDQGMKIFKLNPEVTRVRDQIAQELAGQFGKEKVSVRDLRIFTPLQ